MSLADDFIYKLDFSIKNTNIKFELHPSAVEKLMKIPYKFGFSESSFGEAVFYRTYSRTMIDGSKESWPHTVIRFINGVMTIRKWWYKLSYFRWNEDEMQKLAYTMAESAVRMHWLPPGRGIQNMGTDYVYERGAMCLYNCAFAEVNDLVEDCAWIMDALLSGSGVGFGITGKEIKTYLPNKKKVTTYVVADSKEGWTDGTKELIRSYVTPNSPTIKFDYSKIRPKGTPVRGMGGTASGPDPLIELHNRIRTYCEEHISGQIDSTRLVADIVNAIGVCVVVGNIRRSAEIAIGSPENPTFLDLKNYNKYPERKAIGWMSNNSVRLSDKDHFMALPEISDRIINNGEPGLFNLINTQKYARFGTESHDKAIGLNPCGEIPLESHEVCNLAEVFPTRCKNKQEFMTAIESATFYSSTVALYPTHSQITNEIIARNRRIGVSLSGIAEWFETYRTNECVRWLRDGYTRVKEYNEFLASKAGVNPSVRLTTVKPSGTISNLVGVPSGMHYPVFNYAIRRMIISVDSPIYELLDSAGFYHEPLIRSVTKDELSTSDKLYHKYQNSENQPQTDSVSVESQSAHVFEFPICNGKIRSAIQVSAWEQFCNLAALQREWADNSVSCTIYFNMNGEAKQINHMLSQFAPVIKSVSMLPHSDKGVYPQMPYEGIDEEKFKELLSNLKPVEWRNLKSSIINVDTEKYCSNDTCQL